MIRLQSLGIEFTAICNLRCKWCILDESRKKGYMDVDFFRELCNYIVDNKDIRFSELSLHNAGEILLHPRFEEMLFIMKRVKERAKHFPYVYFLTNATRLTIEKINAILESGVVDFMRFSLDGGNKESFEEIRRGAKWEEVLENVRNFLYLNKKTGANLRTGIICIEVGATYSREFKELIENVTDFIPITAHNWDGSKHLKDYQGMDTTPKKYMCKSVRKGTLVILWDGQVVPCCADLNGRGIVGDLKKETLFDVWSGVRMQRIIELMRQGRRTDIELCKNCALP